LTGTKLIRPMPFPKPNLSSKPNLLTSNNPKSLSLGTKLDSDWFSLRINGISHAGMNQQIVNCEDNSPSMTEALQIYLHLKLDKKPHSFATGVTRNIDYLTEAIGNKPITSYTIIDAVSFETG
tara:strand:- start:17 stop:385 length:369 start_codon:yes stop_codon:yes gene_type:complete